MHLTYIFSNKPFSTIIPNCVRNVSCIFAHIYSIVGDSERPWTVSAIFTTQSFTPNLVWVDLCVFSIRSLILHSYIFAQTHNTGLVIATLHIVYSSPTENRL